MDIIYPRCAAIDVHKRTAVATIGVIEAPGQQRKHTRTFSTMLGDLERLAGWLGEHGVTHVALESTGVYVRRFTARAIPPAGRTGAEGHLWANDSPYGESQGGQEHVVEAGRDGRRVGPSPARPVCYGESLVA
jgi:hypothetical protein